MDFAKELFEKTALYFDLFDRMEEEIFVFDCNYCLQYVNRAVERSERYLLKDVKGKHVNEIYDFVQAINTNPSPILIALSGKTVDRIHHDYIVDGKLFSKIVSAAPIYKDGQLIGAYSVQRDITNLDKIAEENIALQQAINNEKSKQKESDGDPFAEIIGSSEIFFHSLSQARRSAATDSAVLLIGNTGCGKEIFARAIHESSSRAKKPFLALNCASIPENLIESILFGTTRGVYTGAVEKKGLLIQANGGTVFLDEINSMPLASQAKLLRVLEEKKVMRLGDSKEVDVDIRVISSCNESPEDALAKHHIRTDLFFRLSVVQIRIPDLKDRKEDIPLLVKYFIKKYNTRFSKQVAGIDYRVMSLFQSYDWPGNVRQLKSCIESAMNFSEPTGYITLQELPDYFVQTSRQQGYICRKENIEKKEIDKISYYSASYDNEFSIAKLKNNKDEQEKNAVIDALRRCDCNISQAAKLLGISRQLLNYRIKKYRIR